MSMKAPLWTLLIVALTAIGVWLFFGPWFPRTTWEMTVYVAFFMASGLGGMWALYMIVRHETRIFPVILIAFVPYGFLWYYFERMRRNGPPKRHPASP